MVQKNIKYHISSLFMIASATVMCAVILVRQDLFKELFSYGAYYLVFALFLVWLFALFQYVQQHNSNFQNTIWAHKNGIIVSVLITSIIFTSVKPMFRVLSDETNLVAVSKSMVYEKRTDNVTMGKWYYDNFYPLNREIEKRPLMFPFFLNIIHTFIGYRPENVFILNFFVLLALLYMIYLAVKDISSEMWAIVAVIFVASQPIVSQCATSGGFDLFATVFLLMCLLILYTFLNQPSAATFQLLWVSLLMLTNTRYEGILPFLIIMGFLAALNYVKSEYFKGGSAIIYSLTPLLILPVVWQRFLVQKSVENPPDVPAFSWGHFINNNLSFLKSLVDFRFYLPYATLVNILGLAGLLFFLWTTLVSRSGEQKKTPLHLGLISTTILAVYWLLFTSYYFGKIDHPSSSRFFVFFMVLFSLCAVLFLYQFKIFREKAFLTAILALMMFGLYHTVSVEDRFSRTQLLPREYRFAVDFFKRRSENERGFLIIASRPGQYTVYNFGAVNFSYANKNLSILTELKNHLYDNVYVIQEISYENLQPSKDTELDKNFSLEKLADSQNNTQFFIRISRVKV